MIKKTLIFSGLFFCTINSFAIGSIAFNPTNGKSGMSWNASSIEQAENLALQYCGFGSCKIVTDFQKTCAALAASSNYGYGWGKGSNLSTVKIEALDQCRKYPSNDNCTIVISQCDK